MEYITLSEHSQGLESVKERRKQGYYFSKIVGQALDHKYEGRARNCATWVETAHIGEKEQIVRGNFCKIRCCPICAAAKTIKTGSHLRHVVDIAKAMDKPRWLFLTLTTPNVPADVMPVWIDKMMYGINRLTKYKKFRQSVLGWFRSMEITYNRKRRDYHPHFHLLLAVEETYFNRGKYISHAEWKAMWQEAMDSPHEYIVDVRAIKGEDLDKSVLESAKYSVKSADYLTGRPEIDVEIYKAYYEAIHGRRLVGFGGTLRKYHQGLDVDDAIWQESPEDTERLEAGKEYPVTSWAYSAAHGDYVMSDSDMRVVRHEESQSVIAERRAAEIRYTQFCMSERRQSPIPKGE